MARGASDTDCQPRISLTLTRRSLTSACSDDANGNSAERPVRLRTRVRYAYTPRKPLTAKVATNSNSSAKPNSSFLRMGHFDTCDLLVARSGNLGPRSVAGRATAEQGGWR